MAIFAPFFDALNRANLRYVVVGGLATVLHGYTRLTVDSDLMVDLALVPPRPFHQLNPLFALPKIFIPSLWARESGHNTLLLLLLPLKRLSRIGDTC